MTEVVDELGNLSKEEGGNKKVKKSRGARKANLTEGGGNKKGYDDRRVATVDGMSHIIPSFSRRHNNNNNILTQHSSPFFVNSKKGMGHVDEMSSTSDEEEDEDGGKGKEKKNDPADRRTATTDVPRRKNEEEFEMEVLTASGKRKVENSLFGK